MMKINPATILSIHLKPLACNIRMSKTSATVITIPQVKGIPKSKFKAMAEPITSAKSIAAIAISQKTQRKKLTTGGK